MIEKPTFNISRPHEVSMQLITFASRGLLGARSIRRVARAILKHPESEERLLRELGKEMADEIQARISRGISPALKPESASQKGSNAARGRSAGQVPAVRPKRYFYRRKIALVVTKAPRECYTPQSL